MPSLTRPWHCITAQSHTFCHQKLIRKIPQSHRVLEFNLLIKHFVNRRTRGVYLHFQSSYLFPLCENGSTCPSPTHVCVYLCVHIYLRQTVSICPRKKKLHVWITIFHRFSPPPPSLPFQTAQHFSRFFPARNEWINTWFLESKSFATSEWRGCR